MFLTGMVEYLSSVSESLLTACNAQKQIIIAGTVNISAV